MASKCCSGPCWREEQTSTHMRRSRNKSGLIHSDADAPPSHAPDSAVSTSERAACTAAPTQSVLERSGLTESAGAYDERHGKSWRTSLSRRAVWAGWRPPSAPAAPHVCNSECTRGQFVLPKMPRSFSCSRLSKDIFSRKLPVKNVWSSHSQIAESRL